MEDRPIRALLVEDDLDDAFLLRHLLDEVPEVRFDLVHAERLGQALELAGQSNFDVALLDLTLPDSTGLDTFRLLHRGAPELALVVLSGLDDEAVAMAAVQEGAQDYLVKGQVSANLLVRSLRYAIERQRAGRYRDLLTERQRFDTAISQMTDGILVTDAEWRVINANRAACLLVNLSDPDWRDLPLGEALAAFELSVPVEELRGGGNRVTAFQISRPDTHPPLYLDARLSRLFDATGELTSAVLMLRDVTDERLARHIQANFFTLLPHKLRTHLAILNGYLELTRDLPPAEALTETPHIFQVCKSEVTELTAIVQELLDFKALYARELSVGTPPTLVAPILAAVLDEVRLHYPDQVLEVATELDTAAIVDVTPDHLGLVLQKLLDNAVKFADKTPLRLGVRVTGAGSQWLSFEISDNGPGIPHEYYDRIFEGFVQVEEHVTGQVAGLGIGLHMAREIVKAYGGELSVHSHIGEGSTFTFTLPSPPPPPTDCEL